MWKYVNLNSQLPVNKRATGYGVSKTNTDISPINYKSIRV